RAGELCLLPPGDRAGFLGDRRRPEQGAARRIKFGHIALRTADRPVEPDPRYRARRRTPKFTPSVTASPSSIGFFGTALPKMVTDCAQVAFPPIATASDTQNNKASL